MPKQKQRKDMDYNNTLNVFLGGPISSLEIDNSRPDYVLEDYQMDQFQVGSHSLDVSFGGRKVVIDVRQGKWNK